MRFSFASRFFAKSQGSLAIIAGNILDHYDTNLYSFLAPVLAPYFFPAEDRISALILTYGIMSSSLLTRPLGTYVFGRYAWRFGPQHALGYSLLGLSFSTILIGFLPTYATAGGLAPLLLALFRSLQGFFAGGEHAVTGLFLMAETKKEKRVLASSLYQSSTVLGILCASFMGMLCALDSSQMFWRACFLVGSLTGFAGSYLRRSWRQQHTPRPRKPLSHGSILRLFRDNPRPLFAIAAVSGLSYVTYAVPFVFLNVFAGLVSDISYSSMMTWNTLFLLADMVLCPILALAVPIHRKASYMMRVAAVLGATVLPLFYFLPQASLIYFLLVRIWIVVLGLALLGPMYAWFYEITSDRHRYLYKGLGYTLGTELFGRGSTAVCLWLWHKTSSPLAPALYVTFVCAVTIAALRFLRAAPTHPCRGARGERPLIQGGAGGTPAY